MIPVGKFAICGDWDDTPTPEGMLRIVMCPLSHVFGAGWAPHTQAALLALPEHVRPGMSFLELGAGSCILSVAAEKLGASPCYATELNPEALAAGRRVLAANGSHVELIEGTFLDRDVDLAVVSISSQWAEEHAAEVRATKILVIEDDATVRVARGRV